MEDIYENIHTPAQQATNTLAQSPPTSSENLYHYMVGAQAAIKQLKEGVVVTVYSLKRKPERLHLMALPDLCLLQCVRALGARPEITGKMERKMEKGDLGRRKTLCVCVYIFLSVWLLSTSHIRIQTLSACFQISVKPVCSFSFVTNYMS